MICYMDITFCTESTCSKFGDKKTDCPRSLTLAVEHMAAHWWNDNSERKDWTEAPIATFYGPTKPDCYEEK